MSGNLGAVLPEIADLVFAELYEDPPTSCRCPGGAADRQFGGQAAQRVRDGAPLRRVALERLGMPAAPILKGTRASPAGPPGWWAASPHQGLPRRGGGPQCRCAFGGHRRRTHDVLPDRVLEAVSLPAERREIAALPGGLHWDRILFCAKEATTRRGSR